MAATDFITSSRQKIREGDTAFKRPNSEAVMTKIGGSMNFILDRIFYDLTFNWDTYINGNEPTEEGRPGIMFIEKDADIVSYWCAMFFTGDAGSSIFNFKVFDDTGAFVNNLFGSTSSRFLIGGQSGTNTIVGRKDLDTTPSVININTGGITKQEGVLNITTLLAGQFLVPFLEEGAFESRNAQFIIRLKEQ